MALDSIRTPKIPQGTDSWCPPLRETQGWCSLKLLVIHGAEAQAWASSRQARVFDNDGVLSKHKEDR